MTADIRCYHNRTADEIAIDDAEEARLAGLREKQRRQEQSAMRVICEIDQTKCTPDGCPFYECDSVRKILDIGKGRAAV